MVGTGIEQILMEIQWNTPYNEDRQALMINEENFYLATRERKPYVVDSGGVKSFYAVCPECDNPIQLIGLLRRQQDSLPPSPIWAAYRT